MISANIPMFKLKNMELRSFLSKYCNRAIPEESTLRKTYMKSNYLQIQDIIRNTLIGKYVWASVDETTDSQGKYVANLLVGVLGDKYSKPYVVGVKVLERTNHETVARFVNDILRELLNPDQLVLLLSDAAKYMVLQVFYPIMIHLTCLCHALHRVAEEVRSVYPVIDELINQTKKVFRKAPYRTSPIYETCPDITLPPRPVITRWGTWIEAAIYYCDNFVIVKAVVESLEPNSDAVRKSQAAFKTSNLAQDLAFIKAHFSILSSTITKLETQGLSLDQSMELVENVQSAIAMVPGAIGEQIQIKLDSVLRNNPGFDVIQDISMVLRGQKIKVLRPPDVIASLKFAPVQSCDVERSFSVYKTILADNRSNFTPESLEMYLISHCFYDVCH